MMKKDNFLVVVSVIEGSFRCVNFCGFYTYCFTAACWIAGRVQTCNGARGILFMCSSDLVCSHTQYHLQWYWVCVHVMQILSSTFRPSV